MMRVSRKALIIMTISLVSAVAGIACMLFIKEPLSRAGGNSVVATINGEPLTTEEFKLLLAKNRASTYTYFKSKYNVDDSLRFWNGNYGGEVPIEKLKTKALNESVNIKIQQLLAKQKGVVKDISYPAFVQQLQAENERRKEAVRKKQAIYGPVSFDEKAYYGIVIGNLAAELKKNIGQESTVSDQVLQRYYELNKDVLFAIPDTIRIKKLSVAFTDLGTMQKEDARVLIDEIHDRWVAGEVLDKLLEAYGQQNSRLIAVEEQSLDNASLRVNTMKSPILTDTAEQLSVGGISHVFEENGAFTMMECLEKIPQGYRPFLEVKEQVKSDVIDQQYNELVAQLMKDAVIHINNSVYNSIIL
ncbi:peptidylprolyl isomerase [Paenibacillus whitsoniae]|uniref:peptidylprolyl isomerase n=1 Tax=Paenibacillus whitsoniae TaxID=2496558 RepID=A0A3S0IDZ0_9BACL|nr:hypothetical protein [Paenibacillus whitsoniae]RTE10848.1 hypothetical protein EJQ19_06190 [Paenibacillus whitsoniae]